MSKYGMIAELATAIAQKGLSPQNAWREASYVVFPTQKTSREKGCPRCAFLGLASEGLIRSVPAGNYTRSKDNKHYAIEAIKVLSSKPELASRPDQLWAMVLAGQETQHNAQMEVVVALWSGGHITRGA